MHGIVVFPSLKEALQAGYHLYDKTLDDQGSVIDYLVRKRKSDGRFALALVVNTKESGN